MNIQNLHVKHIIDDIIDVAYGEETEEKRKKYKEFQFFILSKQRSSVSGYYYAKEHKVEVFNISKHGEKSAIKTSLHEVAHHLDYCINGSVGHQKSFYREYEKLIYAALNMQIILPEELKSDSAHNDSNKVKKIVDAWIPSYTLYADEKKDTYVGYVKENYYIKELLIKKGYKRCEGTIYWNKEISEGEKEAEIQFLESCHAQYEIKRFSFMDIYDGYIVAVPINESQENELKNYGFSKQKSNFRTIWIRNTILNESMEEIDNLMKKEILQGISFKIEKISNVS